MRAMFKKQQERDKIWTVQLKSDKKATTVANFNKITVHFSKGHCNKYNLH